jgi:hypothetical protein
MFGTGRNDIRNSILKDQSGVSALEFAVVLPLLFMLIAGVVELGRAYHEIQVLHDALRQGARVAVDLSRPAPAVVACSTLTTAAQTAARQYLNRNGLDPDLSITDQAHMPWQIVIDSIPANTRTEGGTTIHFIQLNGRRNPAANFSWFSPAGFLSGLIPNARTSFPIRGTCS